MAEIISGQALESLELFDIRAAHIWSKIKVKCWNSLAAMHFVLGCLQRDACYDACGLYPFGWSGFAMTGAESIFQYPVEGVLYAS